MTLIGRDAVQTSTAQVDVCTTTAGPGVVPRRRHHRRRWLVVGLVAVLLTTGLGLALASGIQADHQLRRTRRTLTHARARLRGTLAHLAEVTSTLATVDAQGAAAQAQLTRLQGQLSTTRQQLGAAQDRVRRQGISISALDQCLDGVEAALNQVSLHDPRGAAASLRSVADSCRTAEADDG